jgi:hypothetical protein
LRVLAAIFSAARSTKDGRAPGLELLGLPELSSMILLHSS